jgi:hypothetical protein
VLHNDSYRAQCCLELSLHGNVSVCVNKFFHFALKRYFTSKRRQVFLAHSVFRIREVLVSNIGASVLMFLLPLGLSAQMCPKIGP